MTNRPVPFAHAGPIDSSKRNGSSCETAIGQERPLAFVQTPAYALFKLPTFVQHALTLSRG